MRTSRALLMVGVVAGLCMFFVLLARAEEKTTMPPKTDLTQVTPEERDEVTNRLAHERHQLIGDLMNQLDALRKGDAKGKEHIIYLLGTYGATEAVKLLTDMIDFKATIVDPRVRIGRWGLYPAQEALVKIGKPAANEVLRRIASEADPTRRKLMCIVIEAVEGEKVGRLRLTWLLEEEKDPARRTNLEEALKMVPLKPGQ